MNLRRFRSITLLVVQAVASSGFLFSSTLAEDQAHSSVAISLAGTWRVRLDPGDVGMQEQWQNTLFSDSLKLPGSLTTNNSGDELSVRTRWTGSIVDSAWFGEAKFAPYRQPGNIKLPFWLTPQKHFVGAAWYQRELLVPVDWQGMDAHLFLERVHWETQIWVDGIFVGTRNSLCAPHEYALGAIVPGRHRLVIRVDNTPKINVGRDAHSISDHTQTNWNGIIGRMELQASGKVRIVDLQVYPDIEKRTARVRCVVVNTGPGTLNADIAFTTRPTAGPTHQAPTPVKVRKSVPPGETMVEVDLRMGTHVRLWDEFSPVLYALDARLSTRRGKETLGDHKRAAFGMREFHTRGTNFTLNGRVTFLRGTLEGCVFPLTGYPPTETPEWERVFKAAKDYGLNHIRFHSWCPPDAAFEAADCLGIILHIETPVWTTLGEDPAVDAFIYAESDRILKAYGNHPSFCMLAVGNEPSGEKRNEFLAGIVSSWKKKDPRRLYTTCSGWPILPESDYNSTGEPRVQNVGFAIKSRFNTQPLSTNIDYTSFISQYKVPTVSHEVGQWCVFPDLKETTQYTGILKARNFEIVRDDLEHKKMLDQAEDFLMASGKLQVLEYKEEIEAALRTPGFGGFQLLGLHDFPGQGTALVGVLNAFWRPKGYVSAEQFRQFCSNAVPLMRMKKGVWTTGERFAAEALFANYSATDLRDAVAEWSLTRPDGTVFTSGTLGRQNIRQGRLNAIGHVTASLQDISRATKLTLTLGLRGTEYTNSWDIWIYPETLPVHFSNELVVATEITPEVEGALAHGGTVLLMANPKRINSLVPPGFSSIFWNTSWSGKQPPHTLGVLCDPRHPLFAEFPTESHSTWQWWDIVSNSRAMILDSLPGNLRPLVQIIDDWNTNRKLGLAFEARVATGKLFVCSIDLTSNVEERPVARQLLRSLSLYVSGRAFQPQVTVDLSLIRRLFRQPTIMDEAKFVRVDSEVRGFEGPSAVDGDPTTFWHTPWEGNAPGYPHVLELDLGKPIEIRGYKLQPRTDGITGGWIAKASISVSDDGVRWSPPVSTDSFERNKGEKRVLFSTPVRTRFVRLTALEGFAGQGFASIAEFGVIGSRE